MLWGVVCAHRVVAVATSRMKPQSAVLARRGSSRQGTGGSCSTNPSLSCRATGPVYHYHRGRGEPKKETLFAACYRHVPPPAAAL